MPRFSPQGDRIYYRDGQRWYYVAFTGDDDEPFTSPRFVLEGEYQNPGGPEFEVSPDGKRLLLLERTAASSTTTLSLILSCGKPFESLDIGGLPLDRCEPCRTYWFDRRELEAFLKIVPPLKQKRGTGSLKLPTPATCPRCETPTLEHGSWHSVPMARCATCRGLLIGYDGIREISTKMTVDRG